MRTLAKPFVLDLLFFIAPLAAAVPRADSLSLDVVYPREGLTISAADSAFVFGHVMPAEARVLVENISAKKYANGTFLVVVPVRPGNFTFDCRAIDGQDTVQVLRSVYVPPYLQTGPVDSFGIDESFVFPREPLEVQPGDHVTFFFKGSPGSTAYFSISDVASNVPMAEKDPRQYFDWGEAVFGQGQMPAIPPVEGIYSGSYVFGEADAIGEALVQFTLISPQGEIATLLAPGRLSIFDSAVPRVGRLEREITIGRTGPGKGFYYFFPAGINLWITGRDGDFYRARLSETSDAWVPVSSVLMQAAGAQPARSDVVVARTSSFDDHAEVRVFLQEKLPFRISQSETPQELILTLYGGLADTDWIRHEANDPMIGEITWQQRQNDEYDLVIHLNQKQQWGYRAYFRDNDLILEIRKPPVQKRNRGKPLRGLLICIDPGHGPDLGAIGPTGLTEKDATLAYANTLKQMFEKKGAQIFMTREQEAGINLATRSSLADAVNADLFLSLHFNALPDGVNPFISRGTSTYYYHTQSYRLAKSVQQRLLRRTRLPNFGLYYDNLSVCRITSMPAILIEPAFIMHPLEEMKILDDGFRSEVCRGIVEGVEEFLKHAVED